jgi:hypothetical protein
MIWLITGSRDAPRDEVRAIIENALLRLGKPARAYHGAAKGADTHAAELLMQRGIYCPGMAALWDFDGRPAGSRRNRALLEDAIDIATIRHQKLVVVAMPGPNSKGTHNMINQANVASRVSGGPNIEVYIWEVSA